MVQCKSVSRVLSVKRAVFPYKLVSTSSSKPSSTSLLQATTM